MACTMISDIAWKTTNLGFPPSQTDIFRPEHSILCISLCFFGRTAGERNEMKCTHSALCLLITHNTHNIYIPSNTQILLLPLYLQLRTKQELEMFPFVGTLEHLLWHGCFTQWVVNCRILIYLLTQIIDYLLSSLTDCNPLQAEHSQKCKKLQRNS